MGELANCPRCGKLFVKGLRDICDECYKKEEEQFNTVYKFIRKSKNRSATLTEVHDETGVPEDMIIHFIKQGRLQTKMMENLTYPCERCGAPIKTGRLCEKCQKELKSGLNAEQATEHAVRAQEEKDKHTYFSLDERLHKDKD